MNLKYFDDLYKLEFNNVNSDESYISEGLRTNIRNFLSQRTQAKVNPPEQNRNQEPSRANKRMRVLNTAHYTSKENKEKILKHGFNRGSSGVYHPKDSENSNETIYTTPSSRIGKDYGKSRVNLRVVNPKINSTENRRGFHDKYSQAPEDQRKKLKNPQDHSKELIQKGAKIVRVPDAHHTNVKGSYIMMDRDTANKSIVSNQTPTIKSNKPSRSGVKTLSTRLKENYEYFHS